MSSSEIASLAVSGVGAIVNITVLVFLASQIKLLQEQVSHAKDAFVGDQALARKHATLDFLSSTIDRRHALIESLPSIDDGAEIESLLEELDGDPETLRSVIRYLAYYEHIAVGANTGALDIEILDRALGTVLMSVFERYEPWIVKRRATLNRPRAYDELEQLTREIKRRRATR